MGFISFVHRRMLSVPTRLYEVRAKLKMSPGESPGVLLFVKNICRGGHWPSACVRVSVRTSNARPYILLRTEDKIFPNSHDFTEGIVDPKREPCGFGGDAETFQT